MVPCHKCIFFREQHKDGGICAWQPPSVQMTMVMGALGEPELRAFSNWPQVSKSDCCGRGLQSTEYDKPAGSASQPVN